MAQWCTAPRSDVWGHVQNAVCLLVRVLNYAFVLPDVLVVVTELVGELLPEARVAGALHELALECCRRAFGMAV